MQDKLTLFSDMIVFSQYAMQVVMAFMMLVMIFVLVPRASVAAKRINEVLDTEPAIEDGAKTEAKAGMTGEVEFRHAASNIRMQRRMCWKTLHLQPIREIRWLSSVLPAVVRVRLST